VKNLQTNNAPSLSIVVPHFIFGALSFLILSVLIVLSGVDLFGPYFSGKMIALTHLAVLGWGTMLVFGALYQLIPVVFETTLYSEKLAKVTFWLSTFSISLFVYSFWTSNYGMMLIYASSLMFASILLFVMNVLLSTRSAKLDIHSTFITASVIWLLLAALLGLVIAYNFNYQFLSESHLFYLKIHAHLGLIGWFLMLIIGVSSTLIPMFLISHDLNKNKLNYSFYLVNIGLLMLGLDWFFWGGSILIPLYWLSISSGILIYLSFVVNAYRKRLRKELDIGMKHTALSVLAMLIPVMTSLLILLGLEFGLMPQLRVTTIYGFTIIFGIITPIILGQTFKTLPFIIWLHKYKQFVGKFKTPLPKDLYSDLLVKIQFYSFNIAFLILLAAFVYESKMMVTIGSYTLLVTAVMYNLNVFKIVLHKTKTESL